MVTMSKKFSGMLTVHLIPKQVTRKTNMVFVLNMESGERYFLMYAKDYFDSTIFYGSRVLRIG